MTQMSVKGKFAADDDTEARGGAWLHLSLSALTTSLCNGGYYVEECPPGNYEVGRGWSCYRREARESPEEYLLEGDDAEWGNNGALRTYPNIYVHDPGHSSAQTPNLCPGIDGSTKVSQAKASKDVMAWLVKRSQGLVRKVTIDFPQRNLGRGLFPHLLVSL